MNETNDPKVKSWLKSANVVGCDFPLQNLPYGVFRERSREERRIGVAIGDQVFDAGSWAHQEAGGAPDLELFRDPVLNPFLEAGPEVWSEARRALFMLFREDSLERERAARYLHPMNAVEMLLPVTIGDYTDFYASIYHATNVGSMFRPENPLLPNYKWVPIGYHGRASSIVASGAPVVRPRGQTKAPDAQAPAFGPCRQLDYELEVGAIVGAGNGLGEPIPIAQAAGHLFGLCLVNDWSARDVQSWEYQPLGPFLAKNFLTTVSPWIVTMEALKPYRTNAFQRDVGDPRPLPYLWNDDDQQRGGFDITLEVLLSSRRMREGGVAPLRLSRGNLRDMYWTFGQLVAHHTSGGCNLQAGDLLASGTISGATRDSRGCLLELTRRGAEPIDLPSGEKRSFLEDGDEVVFHAYCERDGYPRIGFGECRGVVAG